MLNIFKKTAIALGTSLVSLSAVFFPINQAQSATFQFTIDGVEGSGELSFDDTSLTGADLEVISGADLIDGSFNFEFLIEGESITFLNIFDPVSETEEVITEVTPITRTFTSNFANFNDCGNEFYDNPAEYYQEASFIFESGTLTGITNYDYCYDREFPRGAYEREFVSIIDSVASFEYESASGGSGDCSDFVCEFDGGDFFSATDLPLNFSTVIAWEDPNVIPEPSLIFGLGLLALGLRKIKKS
jgi:hypothetical protein